MFDPTAVSEVFPIAWTGADAKLSWQGTTSGLTWQVYVNREMVYHGTDTTCYFPWPADDVQIDIGSVLPSEATTDFSADLPPAPFARAELFWQGGSYLDPAGGIGGFHVYGEHTAGGGVDYTKALADIPAYTGGVKTDGFGFGGFGNGGFGMSPSNYSWVSAKLTSGTWTFAVKAYDLSGNEGPAATQAVTIRVPPEEPPPFSDGFTRLHYTLQAFGIGGFGSIPFGEPEVVLTWNATS